MLQRDRHVTRRLYIREQLFRILRVMNDSGIAGMVRRFFGEVFEFTILLDLNETRLLPVFIYSKLRNYRPQPARERTTARIVCELAFLVTVRVLPESVQLGPDRAREILGIIVVRRDLSRGRFDGRVEIRDKVFPRLIVAFFTRDDQTEI